MSEITKKFEEFAKFVGSKYALMVNSGSSANLIAFFFYNKSLQKKSWFWKECIILNFVGHLVMANSSK